MLEEQLALDDFASLQRQVASGSDGIRRHITSNIRSRLLEEREHHAKEVMNTGERIRNIQRAIETMSDTRRELSRVRAQWASCRGGVDQPAETGFAGFLKQEDEKDGSPTSRALKRASTTLYFDTLYDGPLDDVT